MSKLRVLDLFSGIGGFSLGLERTGGFETVAFCEIEPFPRKVLAKHWPKVPIHEDVRELTGADVGSVDVICGGYPCQPFSTAGKRQGPEDDRHLWPEFSRLVAELRPAWVIGENVAGHISMGLDDVLSDLEGQGYTCRGFVIPACAVGAPHRRDRTWVVAHASGLQRDGQQYSAAEGAGQVSELGEGSSTDLLAHADSKPEPPVRRQCENIAQQGYCGRDVRERSKSNAKRQIAVGCAGENSPVVAHAQRINAQREQPGGFDAEERAQQGKGPTGSRGHGSGRRGAQPGMGGVFDGLSYWLDEPRERVTKGVPNRAARLKALGNAVVPQIPEMIGRAILQARAG